MIIAPSILNADWANLADTISALERSGADWVHLDIMDGNFVPNISFGPSMVEAIRRRTRLTLDVHLMIDRPQRYIEDFARAGADMITVHPEADTHVHRALQSIRALGKKAGVALNPGTPESVLEPLLDELDMILCMTVNPGFGGQKLIPAALKKAERIKRMIGDRGIILQADGGISGETVRSVLDAGVEALVMGTWFMNAPDQGALVRDLRSIR